MDTSVRQNLSKSDNDWLQDNDLKKKNFFMKDVGENIGK